MSTTLDLIKVGQKCRILAMTGAPQLVQRLQEFGLLEGEEVRVLATAPLGDPLEISAGFSRLSLRKAEAATIQVQPAE